jgi:hypothetical protein
MIVDLSTAAWADELRARTSSRKCPIKIHYVIDKSSRSLSNLPDAISTSISADTPSIAAS